MPQQETKFERSDSPSQEVRATRAAALNGQGEARPNRINLTRAAELTRLYQWLAEDLADWQKTKDPGQETPVDCPVVVQIHGQACWPFWNNLMTDHDAAQEATKVLVLNTQRKEYRDPKTGEAFVFSVSEISTLATLMCESFFKPIAPYVPLEFPPPLMW
jgi:hypothetical protein